MKKDYKKLELDKILDLLSQNAYCDVCRERIKKIKPSFDIDTNGNSKDGRRIHAVVKIRYAEIL
jgi:hypothetical protein